MAEILGGEVELGGDLILSAPESDVSPDNFMTRFLNGISINQNGSRVGLWSLIEGWTYQTFRLPADYPLGITGGTNIRVPELSGFELNVNIAAGKASSAALDYVIEYWDDRKGWTRVAKGTEVGAPADGENVWFKVDFKPVDVNTFWWKRFRLGVKSHSRPNGIFKELIPHDGEKHTVTVLKELLDVIPLISAAPLVDGKRYFFEHGERPGIIELIGGDTYYSDPNGIESVNYTAPNPFETTVGREYVTVPSNVATDAQAEVEAIKESIPFATEKTEESDLTTVERLVGKDLKAFEGDGTTPLLDAGREVSLRFRILTTAPDSDRDCTGSPYRTVVLQSDPEGIRTSVGDLQDAYWLSAPNPSQFACESLYFDIRDSDGEAQVVDHLEIDPVTPGIYANMYYSNDEAPGVDTDSWDGLLWTRVDKHFLLRRKESFAMPEPVTAKYIKLEFTHLQPVWYAPGTFQLPTQYRKHPKWVMDYYLLLYQDQRSQELEHAQAVNVEFDTLDLAYNYYLDDIRQDFPNAPTTVQSAQGVSLLSNLLLREQEEETSRVDPQTLLRIRTDLKPWTSQPAQQGSFTSLLQKIVAQTVQNNNYPVETTVNPAAVLTNVTSLDRDSLIVEKQFPVTSFYLTCRHYYMVSEAEFLQDRAYFAGIKEVTFTREHYATRFDSPLYIETAGDNLSVETNDLDSVNHTWVTYSTTE